MLGILDVARADLKELPLTVRGVFVIKPDKMIASITMAYPQTSARNVDELLRIVDTLQLTEHHSVVTPVNWSWGDDVLVGYELDDEEAKDRFGEVSLLARVTGMQYVDIA
jgi:alkyl hydroperoxide reductase subunit AhpC